MSGREVPETWRPGYVMRVLAVTGVGEITEPTWVAGFDIEAHDGRGEVRYTSDVATAMHFPTPGHLLDAWKCQSTTRPLRDDGEPNRPLTALTVEVEAAPKPWQRMICGSGHRYESTREYMQRTDPVGYDQCREAGRL